MRDYDVDEEIDLVATRAADRHALEPRQRAKRCARSPDSEIYQAYVGSSANPGYRDFAVAAEIVKGRQVHERVSFDVNPTSRQILENLIHDGHICGADPRRRPPAPGRLQRLHRHGTGARPRGKLSLRTVPRNFPGRSGTRDDKVCLVSPETAAASALAGVITDPRDLVDALYPRVVDPESARSSTPRC